MTQLSTSSVTSSYGVVPPGYRLPDAARLGHVTLQVADLARSLLYYEQVLGLRVLHRTNDRATLAAQGTAHDDAAPLVVLHARPGAHPVPRSGRLGLYHFAILLPDRAALGRFLEHLGRIGAYAGMSDHLVSEALYLTDPDGLGIEVYADRPRSTWRSHDRQLEMATAPLDTAGVIAAAGGVPWSGMPVGTIIGHVHLHVADIGEAERFYHVGLGFDKTVWSYPGALFLSAGGYHHHLGTNTWAAQAPRPGDSDAQLLEWRIVLPSDDDITNATRNVANAGHPVVREGESVVIADPWGTRIRLVREDAGA